MTPYTRGSITRAAARVRADVSRHLRERTAGASLSSNSAPSAAAQIRIHMPHARRCLHQAPCPRPSHSRDRAEIALSPPRRALRAHARATRRAQVASARHQPMNSAPRHSSHPRGKRSASSGRHVHRRRSQWRYVSTWRSCSCQWMNPNRQTLGACLAVHVSSRPLGVHVACAMRSSARRREQPTTRGRIARAHATPSRVAQSHAPPFPVASPPQPGAAQPEPRCELAARVVTTPTAAARRRSRW